MRTIFVIPVFLFLMQTLSAQTAIKMPITVPLPGACDSTKVYVLLPLMDQQVKAVPPLSYEEILLALNSQTAFLKSNPKFKGRVVVTCIINCKGKLIQSKVSTKSGSDELDRQVLAYLSTLTDWKPGMLTGDAVDSVIYFTLDVEKGKMKYPY